MRHAHFAGAFRLRPPASPGAILLLLAATATILMPRSASAERTGGKVPASPAAALEEFEQVYARYLQGDPGRERTDAHNAHVNAYNAEATAANEAQAKGKAELDRSASDLQALHQELDRSGAALKTRPDPADGAAVDAYNRKVEEYNRQADIYKKRAEEYNRQVARFQSEGDTREQALAKQKSALDAERSETDQANHDLAEWFRQHQDVAYGRSFMAFYADLAQKARANPGDSQLRSLRDRARDLRRKLGEFARRKQQEENGGVLIVTATIGEEECYLVLDTGAGEVSISPELVAALGLAGALGEEHETAVAGGMTARGRELTLPSVQLGEARAEQVPALAIASSMLGVDGLLGRSFLRNFVLTIDAGTDPKIILARR